MGSLCAKDTTEGTFDSRREGGRRLGGAGSNPADARDRMLAAAEARQGAYGTGPTRSAGSSAGASGAAGTGSQGRSASGSSGPGGGGKVGGASGGSAASASAAAEAAERRAAHGGGNISDERAKELAERRQKDDIIGKIRFHYHRLGEDEPIGLPSASIEALKKTLAHVKNRKPM